MVTLRSVARPFAAAAVPALLVATLTACGSDSGGDAGGAPTDASKEDFCRAYQAEPDLDESLASAPPEEQAQAIKAGLDELVGGFEETGTPEDIPDDAREGFEASIDAANDISESDIQTAIEENDTAFFDNLGQADQDESIQAFEDWASEYC